MENGEFRFHSRWALERLNLTKRKHKIEKLEDRLSMAVVSFSPLEIIGDIGLADQLIVADVDGDNDLDTASTTVWFENDIQNGTLDTRRALNFSIRGSTVDALAAGDINADGDVDLIFSNSGSLSGGRLGDISFFENQDGTGRFSIEQTFSKTVGGAQNISIGDIDGDGDLDVVSDLRDYLDRWVGVIAWHENENGRFVSSHRLPVSDGFFVGPTTLVDVDGDGDLDIMPPMPTWYKNNGDGEFSEQRFYDSYFEFSRISVGDMDGDGDMDALAVHRKSQLQILRWYENTDGNGDFKPIDISIDTEVNPVRINGVVISDIDNDGDIDPIAWSPSSIFWHPNEGGNLKPREDLLVDLNGFIKNLVAGDLDNDNDLDLIAVYGERDDWLNQIVWFENQQNRLIGDVNCDNRFDSADLVKIFLAQEYEDGVSNNSTYNEGDFDGDGDFTSSDFVFAFNVGAYLESEVFSNTDESSRLFENELEGNTNEYHRRESAASDCQWSA